MMPSPADISLVRENKICPVPRSQETPWVFPACAPVCQHYYKPQVSLFKPLSSYQKYMCGISKSALFFHWCKHYFAWALHPEEGLLWQAGCPQSQAHKWIRYKVEDLKCADGVTRRWGRSLAATRQTTVIYSSEWQPTDNWTKWAGNTHQAWVSLISPPIQPCQPKPGNRSHLTEMRTGTPLQCWKEAYWTSGRELFLL